MTFNHKNFNPRVIINDHFFEIKTQIDIKTETLLLDQTLSHQRVNELNDYRAGQIEEIDEIREINLKCFENFNENEYLEKWNPIIDHVSYDYKKKCDLIKEEIICIDCFLVEQPRLANGIDLWVTPCFFNSTSLSFLR